MPQEGYTAENTEKQLSQQEIEAEISEIDLRRVGLISKHMQLQNHLEGLLHSYGIGPTPTNETPHLKTSGIY